MIRGSMQVHDAVRAWECSSMELSPTTASRDTISNLHPFSPFVPEGNQFDILSSVRNSNSSGRSAKAVYCGVRFEECLVVGKVSYPEGRALVLDCIREKEDRGKNHETVLESPSHSLIKRIQSSNQKDCGKKTN